MDLHLKFCIAHCDTVFQKLKIPHAKLKTNAPFATFPSPTQLCSRSNGRQGTLRKRKHANGAGTTRADLGIWQNITLFASALVPLRERKTCSGEDCRSSAATARGYSRRTAEEQPKIVGQPASPHTITLEIVYGVGGAGRPTCNCSGPEIELILSPQKLICKAPAAGSLRDIVYGRR